MNSMPVNWIERVKSGKFISPFNYNHPVKVMERNTTRCSGYVPGGYKVTTNK